MITAASSCSRASAIRSTCSSASPCLYKATAVWWLASDTEGLGALASTGGFAGFGGDFISGGGTGFGAALTPRPQIRWRVRRFRLWLYFGRGNPLGPALTSAFRSGGGFAGFGCGCNSAGGTGFGSALTSAFRSGGGFAGFGCGCTSAGGTGFGSALTSAFRSGGGFAGFPSGGGIAFGAASVSTLKSVGGAGFGGLPARASLRPAMPCRAQA